MIILREYLGGNEFINLGTPEGMQHFVQHVVQDETAAEEMLEALKDSDDGVLMINLTDAEFVERYTIWEYNNGND